MKQMYKQATLVVASLVMMFGVAVLPVSAEHGSGDSTTGDTTNTTSHDGSSDSGGSGTSSGGSHSGSSNVPESTDDSSGSGTSGSGTSSGKLRAEADELLSNSRKDGTEHNQAGRQKACVQRQKSIEKRATNYASSAQKHLDVFNSIFTKVQAFQTSKQLNVPNYDTLVAAATAKQTAAQSAVDALKALNVTIDCTQSDPASTVATIKSAVSDARKALQDYRTAIKNVIVALKGASTQSDSSTTTTGGDQ